MNNKQNNEAIREQIIVLFTLCSLMALILYYKMHLINKLRKV